LALANFGLAEACVEIFAQPLFSRYTRRLFRIWGGEDFFVHSKRLGTFF
jgi:hypothetical protein